MKMKRVPLRVYDEVNASIVLNAINKNKSTVIRIPETHSMIFNSTHSPPHSIMFILIISTIVYFTLLHLTINIPI